ncbi:MAG: sugar transferase [Chitinophagaceae bacterium]|nr:sugar transferase [Chitinophagaceae bacterium]
MYKLFFKRLIDVSIASITFLLLSPVIVVVTILLYIANKGKPFFFQDRIGKDEKVIQVIKFKSMNDERDAAGKLLPDNVRLTRVGSFVRKTSLDELPQLINVLRGDMSLVGPRPLLPKYLPLYSEEQHKRHLVQPGITGWAQVNGRNSISWTEKFKLDVYYQQHISFCLDTKILFLTVLKGVKREGVNQTEERPMMPFNGFN